MLSENYPSEKVKLAISGLITAYVGQGEHERDMDSLVEEIALSMHYDQVHAQIEHAKQELHNLEHLHFQMRVESEVKKRQRVEVETSSKKPRLDHVVQPITIRPVAPVEPPKKVASTTHGAPKKVTAPTSKQTAPTSTPKVIVKLPSKIPTSRVVSTPKEKSKSKSKSSGTSKSGAAHWTDEDGYHLVELVEEAFSQGYDAHTVDWNEIAKELLGHNARGCRAKWHHHLKLQGKGPEKKIFAKTTNTRSSTKVAEVAPTNLVATHTRSSTKGATLDVAPTNGNSTSTHGAPRVKVRSTRSESHDKEESLAFVLLDMQRSPDSENSFDHQVDGMELQNE
jgi:hypothetical protein